MRGPDRRRGSPPPRGRGYGPPMRRPRSRSPDGFRRSPTFKRHRRDDDRFDGPPRRRGPPRDYDDEYPRRGPRSPRRRDSPMTYREFTLTLHDDVTPEESKALFEGYLADWFGSSIRAEFEARKGEAWMRKQFDPREMQHLIDQRNELVSQAAAAFAEALRSGSLDPAAEGFEQGDDGAPPGPWPPSKDTPPEGEARPMKTAPAVCSTAARIQADLELSRRLVRTLDEQKGVTANPLLPKEEANGEPEAAEQPPTPIALPSDPQQLLDLQLTYLWRVHGVDYYGCREYGGPEDPSRVGARRTRRAAADAAPDDASRDGKDGDKEDEDVKLLDELWGHRLEIGDVMEKPLQKERMETLLDEWVEEQVIKHEENKWGCTLSNKLFVGREYVLKHIRTKHPERLQEQRDRVLDEIYWDNFREFRQREQDEAPSRDGPGVLDAAQLPVLPLGMPGGMPAIPGAAILGGPMPGQVLVPAPGAGPLGPFVLAPVGGKVPGPAPPRGPPPGRGRGRGRGPGPGRGRGREYHDLDAPYNNRAVLDYSDL